MHRSKLFAIDAGRFLLDKVRRNSGWRVVWGSGKQQDLHFPQQNLHLL
jgi:hypothetical protein